MKAAYTGPAPASTTPERPTSSSVLTDDRIDPRAKIPDYKVCAVRLQRTTPPDDDRPVTDVPLAKRGAIKDQARQVLGNSFHYLAQPVRSYVKRPAYLLESYASKSVARHLFGMGDRFSGMAGQPPF